MFSECSGDGSRYASCGSVSCTAQQPCEETEEYCKLDNSCKPLGDPCNCNTVSASQCGVFYAGIGEPTYKLIGETTVQLTPTIDSNKYFSIPAEIFVAENDILAFTTNSVMDTIQCEPTGDWVQNQKQEGSTTFQSLFSDFVGTSWKNDTNCYFNAIYSTAVTKTLPTNMGYFTTPGEFTYSFSLTDMALSDTTSVTVEEEVSDVALLYPSLESGQASDIVYLLVDNATNFVIHPGFGSNMICNWTIASTLTYSTTFSTSCPSDAQTSCNSFLNWPEYAFTSTSHTYTNQGLTATQVTVYNNVSSVDYTFSVKSFKIISGIELNLPASATNPYNNVEYNKNTILSVTYNTSGGTPTTYSYSVNGTSVSGSGNSMTYNYNSLASYVVQVNASDEFSHMVAEIIVNARVKANFANIVYSVPPTVLSKVQYTYTVSADVDAESNIDVSWNFLHGATTYTLTNVSSTISHDATNTYQFAFTYPVEVKLTDTAFDETVTRTFYVAAVEKLVVISLTPSKTLLATGETLTATLANLNMSGTFGIIYYSFNWGDGNVDTNETTTSKTHVYTTAGNYTITGTMTNDASTINTTTEVMIEAEITNLAMTGSSPVLLYADQIFTATSSTGSNVNYVFTVSVDNIAQPATTSNQFIYNFTTIGVYRLNVTASNSLSTADATMEIRSVLSDTLQVLSFTHDSYSTKSSTESFVTDVLSLDNTQLACTWDFGDGLSGQTGTGLFSVSHTFTLTGNFTVSLLMVDPNTNTNLTHTSLIRIQESVADLKITTNGTGKLETGVPAAVLLTAHKSQGTDVIYNYTYAGVSYVEWESNTHLMLHSSQGTVTVTVVAYNLINSVSTTVDVVIQEAVTGVFINCGSCATSGGSTYLTTAVQATFSASVSTGSDLTYTFLIEKQTFTGQSKTYAFNTKGSYNISVTVANLVSSATGIYPMNIQDDISTLAFTNTPTYALVNQAVNMTVQGTGSDITYTWTFCNLCASSTSSLTRYENPGYSSTGTYTVTVRAVNEISSKTVTSSIVIHEEVTTVSVTTASLVSGLYLPISTVISFTCTANVNVYMTYDWIVSGTSSSTPYMNQQTITNTFSAEGDFNVTCNAYNDPSTKTNYLPVKIETPISGSALSLNSSNTIATGSDVQFTLSSVGSTLSYAWTRDSVTKAAATTAILVESFPTNGTYSMECVVSNPLGNSTQTDIVTVLDVVTGADVSFPSALSDYPFVAVGTSVIFTSSVTGGDAFSVGWTLNDLSSTVNTGTGTTFTYTFSTVTNFTLVAAITNAVSSGSHTESIYIQTPITTLSVTSSQSPAKTNEAITFTATHNADADHLVYSWTVEGNSYTTYTNTYTHTFTSDGTYTIAVTAYNEISTQSTSMSLVLQHIITGLALTGCDSEIRVSTAATASVAITTGTDVSYTWTTIDSTSTTQTQTGTSFSFTYVQTAIYEVHIQANNLVDNKNLTCSYTVIGIIADVAIDMSNSIYFTTYTVHFLATGTHFVGVSFLWTIEPTNEVTTTSVATHSKVFSSPNTYTMTLNVSNSISYQEVNITFVIDQLTCAMATMNRIGQSLRSISKAKPIMFEVDIERAGCSDYNLAYTWSVSSGSSCSASTLTPVTLTGVTLDTAKLTLIGGKLDYGTYCVTIEAAYTATPLSDSVSFDLNVTMSTLVAVETGGQVAQRPTGSDITIDGSSSYDPDNSATLSYAWACAQTTTTVSPSSHFVG